MTDLYSLRTTDADGIFRVTKFTLDLDAVSSYLIGPDGCECPGFSGRGHCRHAQIVETILATGRADTGWFLVTDAKGRATDWRQYVGPFDAIDPGVEGDGSEEQEELPFPAVNEGSEPSPTFNSLSEINPADIGKPGKVFKQNTPSLTAPESATTPLRRRPL